MKLLAVDTSTQVCGVALTSEGQLRAEYRLNLKNVHNEKLVAAIHWLLNEVDWSLADLQGIAVAVGPGSFTGLRIGLAVAKGLAFSTDLPLVAVNTLDALAHQAPHGSGPLCAVVKIREGEVCFARYRWEEGAAARQSEYTLSSIEALEAALEEPTLMVIYPWSLGTAFQSTAVVRAAEDCSLLRPLTVARLGHEKLLKNDIADTATLEPFYLKEFKPRKKSYYGVP